MTSSSARRISAGRKGRSAPLAGSLRSTATFRPGAALSSVTLRMGPAQPAAIIRPIRKDSTLAAITNLLEQDGRTEGLIRVADATEADSRVHQDLKCFEARGPACR